MQTRINENAEGQMPNGPMDGLMDYIRLFTPEVVADEVLWCIERLVTGGDQVIDETEMTAICTMFQIYRNINELSRMPQGERPPSDEWVGKG
jgi:hypothetical protein